MIQGQVDNGARGDMVSSFYTGQVGVRARDASMEVAFVTAPPRRLSPRERLMQGDVRDVVEDMVGQDVTLDGVSKRVTRASRSEVEPRMVRLTLV